jgi:geranylgeranyl diphosphate synthase type II
MSAVTCDSPSKLSERLSDLKQLVEEGLDRYSQPVAGCPARLNEAMRYSLLAPGKRFRPLLTLLTSDLCRGSREAAVAAACSVEMVHCYSLIHDDLPAMDDDDLRRGRPTCHIRFGEALAILAGDALLTLAFETLTQHIQPAALSGECCRVLAGAAGAANLVGGQADDMLPDEEQCHRARLESIHRRKTGALIVAALELGAVVSAADDATRTALRHFGSQLGLSFQIADDLLDVQGDAQQEGKRVNKDAQRGKLTFPSLLGVDGSVDQLLQLVDQACDTLEPFGPRADDLQQLARSVLRRLPEGLDA